MVEVWTHKGAPKAKLISNKTTKKAKMGTYTDSGVNKDNCFKHTECTTGKW